MDKFLIRAWNAVVKPDDVVYHLGTFPWASTMAIAYKAFSRGSWAARSWSLASMTLAAEQDSPGHRLTRVGSGADAAAGNHGRRPAYLPLSLPMPDVAWDPERGLAFLRSCSKQALAAATLEIAVAPTPGCSRRHESTGRKFARPRQTHVHDPFRSGLHCPDTFVSKNGCFAELAPVRWRISAPTIICLCQRSCLRRLRIGKTRHQFVSENSSDGTAGRNSGCCAPADRLGRWQASLDLSSFTR